MGNMKFVFYSILAVKLLFVVSAFSQDFDFFYLVQQWPGSYCDTQRSCCYPQTGKPDADFGIHGLWPNYNDGSYPSNCDTNTPLQSSQISGALKSRMQREWPTLGCPSSDGMSFWSHEWVKHGTCSSLDQHSYFQTTIDLKAQVNLLQALTTAGIKPNGETYSLENIRNAIKEGVGYTPFVECNNDTSGNSQLYQIYLCVDKSGANLIECPVFPHGKCGSQIEFPPF